jgi:hypothetical protein
MNKALGLGRYMAVTPLQMSDREVYLTEIEKITHSHTLRKAESLCKLLRYLADHALNQPNVPLKEYQIATEVFGRPRDFDPQADSAIRVQAGRLRLKLIDYYSHEGASDPVVIEMPNGVYAVNFHHRAPVLALAEPAPSSFLPLAVSAASRKEVRQPDSRKRIVLVVGLSAALAAALVAIAILSGSLKSARAHPDMPEAPLALRTFWKYFASASDAPWVVFSNAAFVGRPETGMRYLDPARDSGSLILDHYTGVGEVLAVHELDEVFGQLHHPIAVKRGSLFTLDDAKKNDLIFVGSPAENLTLEDLPGSQEFQFKRIISGPHKGVLAIVNIHPEAKEPDTFYPSDTTQRLTQDYSIVALVPGLNPNRHELILAGATTIGTQAAVEYVCSEDSVEELLRRLHVKPGGEVNPFEALLRVKVSRGVPVGIELVAVRHRK